MDISYVILGKITIIVITKLSRRGHKYMNVEVLVMDYVYTHLILSTRNTDIEMFIIPSSYSIITSDLTCQVSNMS